MAKGEIARWSHVPGLVSITASTLLENALDAEDAKDADTPSDLRVPCLKCFLDVRPLPKPGRREPLPHVADPDS
jgi:hypothetical protein